MTSLGGKTLCRLLCGLGLALSAACQLACATSGGVGIFDRFGDSPEAQQLMNEASDAFVTQLSLETVAGKSVAVLTGGATLPMKFAAEDMKVYGQDTREWMSRVGWSGYVVAALERRLSSLGSRSVTEGADVQLVVNANAYGLQSRIFWVPLFGCDIYQCRSYWAIFDGTADIKTKDGAQILSTQKLTVESHRLRRHRLFGSKGYRMIQ